LRWLLDLPQARAIAGGADNLGQILARSFHRNQSSKRNKKNLVHLTLMVAAGRSRATQNPSGCSDGGQYFYGETDFGSRSLTGPRHTITPPMSMDYDYQAEAKAAMRMAAAAISEIERLTLVRVALAWQDLARGREDKLRTLPPTSAPSYFTPGAHPTLRNAPDPTVSVDEVSRSALQGPSDRLGIGDIGNARTILDLAITSSDRAEDVADAPRGGMTASAASRR
jgi:hypothetical protein